MFMNLKLPVEGNLLCHDPEKGLLITHHWILNSRYVLNGQVSIGKDFDGLVKAGVRFESRSGALFTGDQADVRDVSHILGRQRGERAVKATSWRYFEEYWKREERLCTLGDARPMWVNEIFVPLLQVAGKAVASSSTGQITLLDEDGEFIGCLMPMSIEDRSKERMAFLKGLFDQMEEKKDGVSSDTQDTE